VRGTTYAVALAALATLAACKKTGEGEYQVQTPDVNVSTDTHTVRTPTVEMGKDTTVIERPTVGTTKDTIITPKVKVKPAKP
jgi:hypothetical protein